jgi:hypothetical protein
MPTHISTDMLGAQQEVCCLLKQLSCTSHGGPVAVAIQRQRRSHTGPSPHPLQAHVFQGRPPGEPGCTYKIVRAVRALHFVGSVPIR